MLIQAREDEGVLANRERVSRQRLPLVLVFFFLFEELGYVANEDLHMVNKMSRVHRLCTYDNDLNSNE